MSLDLEKLSEEVVDCWEREEAESMRSGHRATMERFIDQALQRVYSEARAESLKLACEAVIEAGVTGPYVAEAAIRRAFEDAQS